MPGGAANAMLRGWLPGPRDGLLDPWAGLAIFLAYTLALLRAGSR